jgi:hypothetical protein
MTQIDATTLGQGLGRVHAGPMAAGTIRVCGGAPLDRPSLVSRGQTRRSGEPGGVAETPVETNEPATLRLAGKRSGLGAN